MMNWDKLLTPLDSRKTKVTTPLDKFKEDYSKITFSSAFRRLQNKTQIYPLDNNDFVRTRLTHSIEVATIASELGSLLEKELIASGKLDKNYKECISTILRSAALIHDIGNPPFGHFGESVIQDFFKNFFDKNFHEQVDFYGHKWTKEEISDFCFFEGNAQALRQVTFLQYIRDNNGLNLTYPTLATILKYPHSSTEGNKPGKGVSYKKFGYFQSEKKIYHNVIKTLGMEEGGRVFRHPLVFILEAADDMAYMLADLEDGFKKKILTQDSLKGIMSSYLDESNPQEREILNSLYALNVDDLYQDIWEIKLQVFQKRMHSFLKKEVIRTFMNNYETIMKGEFNLELLEVCQSAHIKNAFDEILTIILKDKSVIRQELAGERIIKDLLTEFTSAVISPDKEKRGTKELRLYNLLSTNYAFLSKRYPYKENKLYNELILVTDFICGMTDTYALELYRSIAGISFND